MNEIVDVRKTEEGRSGYLNLCRGVLFTSLTVELSAKEEVAATTELVEGHAYGYAVGLV